MSFSITVCIPVFNQYIADLAAVLAYQVSGATIPVVVFFGDDASEEKFRKLNRPVMAKYGFVYEEMPENTGRARMRNYMAEKANTTHVLFLDGDTIIEHSDFLVNYIESLLQSPDTVFCGGTYFQPRNYDKNKMLHWTYGTKVVAGLHSRRDLEGRFHFMASNFLIKREYFEQVRFQEDLRDYGHEDTIFGHELRSANIDVEGIDNQVLHGSLDMNKEFLDKVSHLVLNLKKLKKSGQYEEALAEIRLVKAARNVKKCGLRAPYLWLFDGISTLVAKNLNGSKPSLGLLNMYKLYLFLKN